jgi:hypothetical protein
MVASSQFDRRIEPFPGQFDAFAARREGEIVALGAANILALDETGRVEAES